MAFAGCTICITGALSQTRATIEKGIKTLGGSTSSSVTNNTTHLVANPAEYASKTQKASFRIFLEYQTLCHAVWSFPPRSVCLDQVSSSPGDVMYEMRDVMCEIRDVISTVCHTLGDA